MLNSIWTDSVQMPEFAHLEHDLTTDVLIIGGGLTGILCASRLAQDGVNYALIEADRICNGVTRNTTAKITSQHALIYGRLMREFGRDAARHYWDANEAAIAEFRKLSGHIECDFESKDHYVYAAESTEELEKELAALEGLGIPAQFRDKLNLPFPVSGAICFPDQGQFHPLKLVSGLVKGMHIYENTAARSFAGNTVQTDYGTIRASKIIVATHFPIINKHGSYYLKMYQQRSYVMAFENAAQVDGMYLDAAANGLSFRNHGELLLIGGGGHRTGKRGPGWDMIRDFAQTHYPNAREVCRWATQDCMTLDGVPYIGQYSGRTPNLYVASGFNKWGMTSSMVAATVLADLVQGRENAYGEVFAPSRTILRPQLFYNALETAWNLLTPTTPRCPHMGCALKWNSMERSWDCPCHGSRFSNDGRLLDNPATGDLKFR